VRARAEREGINFRYFDDRHIGIALDETASPSDLDACGRQVVAGCSECGADRRVGTLHCGACGAL